MHEQRRLARRRWAFERRRRDGDNDPTAVESVEDVSQREGARLRVELVTAFHQARRGVRMEVGAERDDQDVRIERAGVGHDTFLGRIDRADGRGHEAHAGLDQVAVVVPDRGRRLAAEHHVELREPEDKAVTLVDEHDVGVAVQTGREAAGHFQSAEPGTQYHDPRHPVTPSVPRHQRRVAASVPHVDEHDAPTVSSFTGSRVRRSAGLPAADGQLGRRADEPGARANAGHRWPATPG